MIKNEFLRHTLSTISYRFQKSVNFLDNDFGNYSAGKGSRTPKEIVNHMYQVLRATRLFIETERYKNDIPKKLDLNLEIDRFNSELKNIDNVLSEKDLEINYSKRLLQGPFSDILTHIGQISMLSGLNNNPIKGEDFFSANIKTGIL